MTASKADSPDRRALLKGMAGAPLLAALGASTSCASTSSQDGQTLTTDPSDSDDPMNATLICGCGRVDVHAHFLPDVYAETLAKLGMKTLDGGMPVPKWNTKLALETMDRLEIETAIVSLSSPSTHILPILERPHLARQVNLAGKALIDAHPDRFGFFATLPLPDIDASLREIAFALDTLGVDGFILETNSDGVYLGAREFAPIFEELHRRKAVIFLHPTSPDCAGSLSPQRPAPLLEFPLDTTRTIVDMLYNRTIQSNPDIKFIVPHGGAALPSLVSRIATFANVPFIEPRPASEQEVYETLGRLYYDLALSGHPTAVSGLRNLAPMSNILFGSDWPFTPEPGVARAITQLNEQNGFSAEELHQIMRGNAEHLFPRLSKP